MRIQALNAQMNPHFLFNVLNSIQSFIVSNNGDQAERFLAKFAKLTRLMLDGSREEKITIEDEVTSLQLYLELEKLRFENKFNFSIEVDETIDTEFCLIPPLLIQPYVENSILHGMKGIEHEGNILVKMESKKDQIICTIKDNGIGRAKAKAIKNKTNMEHKSVGLLIAKERLQQLNKSIALVELIKIEDLKDESNNPIGTKVEIVIPTF
jgi:LytS/YehU family sensor histidine kinase